MPEGTITEGLLALVADEDFDGELLTEEKKLNELLALAPLADVFGWKCDEGNAHEDAWKEQLNRVEGVMQPNTPPKKGPRRKLKRRKSLEGPHLVNYADGSVFEGELRNNLKHGIGRMTYANLHIYQGQWKHDKPDGLGTFTFPDGRQYVGQWKDGKIYGGGVLNFTDGKTRFKGTYNRATRTGSGKIRLPCGLEVCGKWKAETKLTFDQVMGYDNAAERGDGREK